MDISLILIVMWIHGCVSAYVWLCLCCLFIQYMYCRMEVMRGPYYPGPDLSYDKEHRARFIENHVEGVELMQRMFLCHLYFLLQL